MEGGKSYLSSIRPSKHPSTKLYVILKKIEFKAIRHEKHATSSDTVIRNA